MSEKDREIARLMEEVRLQIIEKATLRIEITHLRAQLYDARKRIEAAKLDAASIINPKKEPQK